MLNVKVLKVTKQAFKEFDIMQITDGKDTMNVKRIDLLKAVADKKVNIYITKAFAFDEQYVKNYSTPGYILVFEDGHTELMTKYELLNNTDELMMHIINLDILRDEKKIYKVETSHEYSDIFRLYDWTSITKYKTEMFKLHKKICNIGKHFTISKDNIVSYDNGFAYNYFSDIVDFSNTFSTITVMNYIGKDENALGNTPDYVNVIILRTFDNKYTALVYTSIEDQCKSAYIKDSSFENLINKLNKKVIETSWKGYI